MKTSSKISFVAVDLRSSRRLRLGFCALLAIFQSSSAYGTGSSQNNQRVLVVSGIQQEGQIAQGPNVVSVLSGGSPQTLVTRLSQINPKTIKAVVSFGVAGALDPKLHVGDVVVAMRVTNDQGQIFYADPTLAQKIIGRLKSSWMVPHVGPTFGTTIPRYTAAAKAALWNQSHAIAVDLETEGAAQWAATQRLPFVMLRTISDPQDFTLPPVASSAVNPNGSYDIGAVMNAVIKNPTELAGLFDLAWDAAIAFGSLGFVRDAVNLGRL